MLLLDTLNKHIITKLKLKIKVQMYLTTIKDYAVGEKYNRQLIVKNNSFTLIYLTIAT